VFEQVITRKERESHKWAGNKLDRTELYNVFPDSGGLGLRVVIRSIRAKELLDNLYQDVFSPVFVKPKPWLENDGAWSAWFGYVEPLNFPMHYVSMT
jgi:hypothetical protein